MCGGGGGKNGGSAFARKIVDNGCASGKQVYHAINQSRRL